MNVPLWLRPKLANWIVWLYAHFIEILPLKPGDCLVVYDPFILRALESCKVQIAFPIPLIDGHRYDGNDRLLFKRLSFMELTAVYNICLKAHQEEICRTTLEE